MQTSNNHRTRTNYLLGFSRIVTGLLFIFSGLIKANDPTGFGYKLEEYFHVFGTHFLNDYAVAIAVVICGFEILLGALLLLGFWGRTVAWGLLLLILFFTFLTFYSAFFEVVTSCGCFGDAIPLTPWQSFSKDLVLFVLILVVFVNRKQLRPIIPDGYTQSIITVALVVVSLGIGIYTINFLPFIDFLPYKKGNNIPALMTLPEGEEGDQYEVIYTLKHKISGEQKTVSDKVYLAEELWKDENWEIIGDPESRLVKKGYQVPIPDLLITDANGEDFTQQLVENPYYNIIVVAWDLNATDLDALRTINALVMNAAEHYNIRSILLTASSTQDAERISDELDLLMEIFYADAVPLKSMVRANPGVLLMQNGIVIDKWHHNTLPDFEVLDKAYFSKAY
ncbi:BT_3928 family protein [Parapedobacter koreensis]|uniref:DoxX protein n=1 Tax=Parapedobacter koreensis TaxID=332977 RepID=A0A1H7I3M0_9SPHI|nr:BT_3928 family protein [Parapedobacter koreensis]SEK57146.1 DoxX protein [Parapedobacter koreensis]